MSTGRADPDAARRNRAIARHRRGQRRPRQRSGRPRASSCRWRADHRCRRLFPGRSVCLDDRSQGLGPAARAGRAQHPSPARHPRRGRRCRRPFSRLGWSRRAASGAGRGASSPTGTNWPATATDHLRVDRRSPAAFRADVRNSQEILEDAGGVAVARLSRADLLDRPRDPWAHAILAEEGYRYSSSVYPVRHDLYGSPDAPRAAFSPCPGLIEIPLTTVRLAGRRPAGLGRRLFPPVSLSADPLAADQRRPRRRQPGNLLSPSRGRSIPASRDSDRRRCARDFATTSISAAPSRACGVCCATSPGSVWTTCS